MANIFTIKHGSTATQEVDGKQVVLPPDGKLEPYELGFNDTDEQLYIGIVKNGQKKAIPVSTKSSASSSMIVPERNRGFSIAEAPDDPVDGELFYVIEG